MATSGLPIADELMAEFYEKGGTIDMSNIKFPNIKDVEKTLRATFIYLRNTNYNNITYDFSRMDYSQKERLLNYYLDTDIEYTIDELTETWLCILYASVCKKPIEYRCILNELEMMTFHSANFDRIKDLWQFILSLPTFAISRLDADFIEIDMPRTDKEVNVVNLYSILKLEGINGLFEYAGEIEPLFYEKLFTLDNNRLFESTIDMDFMKVLYGIVHTDLRKLEGIVEGIKKESEQ